MTNLKDHVKNAIDTGARNSLKDFYKNTNTVSF